MRLNQRTATVHCDGRAWRASFGLLQDASDATTWPLHHRRQERYPPDYYIVQGDVRIPVAQTLARSASSLVSIASGGSIGRESSMVQLSALATALLGRFFKFPGDRLRLLVGCGAAGGLTAAYNAPIAGAFFVVEIILGSIAMERVGPTGRHPGSATSWCRDKRRHGRCSRQAK